MDKQQKGYLDKLRIQDFLKNQDLKIRFYDTIDSTNSEAKRYAAGCDDTSDILFIAREQSAGRGRLGRSFLSRGGCGIYMSLLYFTDRPLCDVISITSAAAVAVGRAIKEITEKPVRIKWVNDIYNDKGKVCGILAETVKKGDLYAVVVGVGINTGDVDFPEELCGVASTIGEIGDKENRLVAKVADSLLSFAKEKSDRSYMKEYRAMLMMIGEQVNILSDGEIIMSGKVVGVSDDGGLILETARGREVIRSGEVSVRNK